MSKDRAARRQARDLDRIQRISAGQERHAAKRRREEARERRRRVFNIYVRPGELAARRRTRLRVAVLILVLINGAIWLNASSNYLKFGAILVSLLIMPIVRILIVDARR
ncbi:MAG TPA: hypothetical protein VMV52_00380 [Candidatus Nanopelagicaceae bacterium]|nr:hypothetical protein [Candidatus Nanopelagicaceae bacterium]